MSDSNGKSSKEYAPPPSRDDVGVVTCRCRICGNWWTSIIGRQCPCGGELEAVDMAAHGETLPRAPYDPSKDPNHKK